jgi:hypothetical protein
MVHSNYLQRYQNATDVLAALESLKYIYQPDKNLNNNSNTKFNSIAENQPVKNKPSFMMRVIQFFQELFNHEEYENESSSINQNQVTNFSCSDVRVMFMAPSRAGA